MPIRNQLFGVYKLLQLKGADGNYRPYVVDRASRNRKMDVEAKNYVQGTAKSRILDIGAISEEIEITLPILLGGAQVMDGRSLVSYYLTQALNETTTVLPLITSATITISSDAGASVNVRMLSDGRPSTGAFRVTNLPIDALTVSGVTSPLDPTATGAGNGPSRVAKFYDFRAKIGKYVYYIMEASITITVKTEKKYFIAGVKDANAWTTTQQYVASAMGSGATGNPLKSTDSNNFYNFNTQFPFIGVSGISVEGKGKAAVELTDASTPKDYDFEDYNTPAAQWEAVNVDLSPDGGGDGKQYELTWQRPGEVLTAAYMAGDPSQAGFMLQIWDPTSGVSGAWTNLLGDVLDLSASVVKSSNFIVTTGVLTADFEFTNWVK